MPTRAKNTIVCFNHNGCEGGSYLQYQLFVCQRTLVVRASISPVLPLEVSLIGIRGHKRWRLPPLLP